MVEDKSSHKHPSLDTLHLRELLRGFITSDFIIIKWMLKICVATVKLQRVLPQRYLYSILFYLTNEDFNLAFFNNDAFRASSPRFFFSGGVIVIWAFVNILCVASLLKKKMEHQVGCWPLIKECNIWQVYSRWLFSLQYMPTTLCCNHTKSRWGGRCMYNHFMCHEIHFDWRVVKNY